MYFFCRLDTTPIFSSTYRSLSTTPFLCQSFPYFTTEKPRTTEQKVVLCVGPQPWAPFPASISYTIHLHWRWSSPASCHDVYPCHIHTSTHTKMDTYTHLRGHMHTQACTHTHTHHMNAYTLVETRTNSSPLYFPQIPISHTHSLFALSQYIVIIVVILTLEDTEKQMITNLSVPTR